MTENTYKYIIKKIIKPENNCFSFNYIPDEIDAKFKIIFNIFITNKSKHKNVIKDKFIFFQESLNSYLHFSRETFVKLFCKIQQTYNAFSKLALLYKYKKSVMSVTTDMILNEIKINEKNIICIYHKNTRYLFNIYDLIKIVNTSLTNNFNFYSNPLPIKNPYNNIPFDKSTLYNIYFYIKFNTDIYDELYFLFFNCNFNLSVFHKKYEHILREYAIKIFVKNSTSEMLMEYITFMIERHNKSNKKAKIVISPEFPTNNLIRIMKPYLLLFLQSFYSLIPCIKTKACIELNKRLLMFNKFNPIFGRKIFKLGFKNLENFKKKSYIKCVIFMDDHIPFNYNSDINFLSDHTNYEDKEPQTYENNDDIEDEVDEIDEEDEEDDDNDEEEDEEVNDDDYDDEEDEESIS